MAGVIEVATSATGVIFSTTEALGLLVFVLFVAETVATAVNAAGEPGAVKVMVKLRVLPFFAKLYGPPVKDTEPAPELYTALVAPVPPNVTVPKPVGKPVTVRTTALAATAAVPVLVVLIVSVRDVPALTGLAEDVIETPKKGVACPQALLLLNKTNSPSRRPNRRKSVFIKRELKRD